MDLALTEEQEMLKAAVRRFVDTEYPEGDVAGTGRHGSERALGTVVETGGYRLVGHHHTHRVRRGRRLLHRRRRAL